METGKQQVFDSNLLDPLEHEVALLVSEVAEINLDKLWEVREKHFFDDLEIDSLLALEILARVETKFGISVPDERLPDITSLMSTINLVRSLKV